jgi:1,4-alpha-glucan branching enzyme
MRRLHTYISSIKRGLVMVTKKINSREVNNTKKTARKINFTMVAPEAQNVFLVGDFNSWDISSHPLKKASKGNWKTNIKLMPGKYEYRFLVDGEWQNDPNCTNCVPNPYGNENCVLALDEE